jgi:hypothetical protein
MRSGTSGMTADELVEAGIKRLFLKWPKPSDGLEPSTPSLPVWEPGNWSQPTATVFARLSRFAPFLICH